MYTQLGIIAGCLVLLALTYTLRDQFKKDKQTY